MPKNWVEFSLGDSERLPTKTIASNQSMQPMQPMEELLKLTEIFLTSSTILIGGFSFARTEPLKTGLSVLGTAMTVLWLICSINAHSTVTSSARASVIAYILPFLFLLGWGISAVVHARLCQKAKNDIPKPPSFQHMQKIEELAERIAKALERRQ